jgi:hypothetical protein
MPVFIEIPEITAFARPPAYRIEQGATAGPERLPGKLIYLQVYLDLTSYTKGGSLSDSVKRRKQV